ncbi:DASH complex subunit Dam1 [Sclerotinia borealis F-4128]|uniref:DASH complex subunit DAM1 n=1 Tax=Sclerotinia borealis (strain F-4128) TaxID=1432307 RepID=W9CLP9_SCLBF|nr:DASH complex subunit Dam1 [Sclerotinia borealis F-4128]
MASTTPFSGGNNTKRSTSASRNPLSRPTTPLRPSSRSSLRDSARKSTGGYSSAPLEAFEPAFAELSDSMADLEANFMHLQLMHESLARFSENFASFLYGLNMNAFCVDFPEAPIPDSFRRAQEQEEQLGRSTNSERFRGDIDGETTFLTTDTSFVDNPPTYSKATPKYTTPAPSRIAGSSSRGGSSGGSGSSGRGIPVPRGGRGGRASGPARGRGRGVR